MADERDSPRLLNLAEVCKMTTLSRATVYRHIADGRFPRPLRLAGRRVAWRFRDICAWLDDSARIWDPSEVI